MSVSALSEAKGWYEALLDDEFRGRKDTDGAARYRLARRLGLSETKLFRLQYKYDEMKDVAGEVYRRLRLAYDEQCLRIEEAADAMRAERMRLKAERKHENAQGRVGRGQRVGVAADRETAAQGEKLKHHIAGLGVRGGQEASRQ